MYSYDKVMNGLAKYVDTEIVSKVSGWKKWIVGSGIGMILSNADNVVEQLKNNEFVKLLNIIDEHSNVNVDAMYKELKRQAQKGSVNIELPMVGSFLLNEHDVDKLYNFITRE